MAEALAGLFGLLIGSFLNVCIYRWPRDLSVVAPRSHCTACERGIAWYDNIPVLSYLILGGRCRHCGAAIHWRYPIVELLTGLSFGFFVYQYGLTLEGLKFCIFAAILIALGFADADTRILPDELTIGGTAIGFVLSGFVPVADSTFHFLAGAFGFQPAARVSSLGEAVLGAVVCAGSIWLAGWLFEKLRHKEGLGLGDVKMLAMIGAFLGVQATLLTIILGSLIGAITGLTWIKLKGEDAATFQLPFGTFLAIGAFLVAIEGQILISWYVNNFL
jgi:leader peptidase (prepilin peptidase)/N-methyltransferase